MSLRKSLLTIAFGLTASLLPSCSIIQKPGTGLAAYQNYDRPAKLPGNPDNVTVKVSIRRQRAYVMEGQEMLLAMPVTVGTPSTPTPRGTYQITDKQEKRRTRNGAPTPYWCGFAPKLGFHTGWLKHYPCTDGSIRMHENLAPKFYRLVKRGTPVEIAYAQTEDLTHWRMPLPPDSGPLPDYPTTFYKGDGYFKQHKDPVFE
jgi:hypothetical protein